MPFYHSIHFLIKHNYIKQAEGIFTQENVFYLNIWITVV